MSHLVSLTAPHAPAAVPGAHIPGQDLVGGHRAVGQLADKGMDAELARLVPVVAGGRADPAIIRGQVAAQPGVVGSGGVDHHTLGRDGVGGLEAGVAGEVESMEH